ncbi:hypothetical protein MSPP1_000846 [Malassezia sp. CBS 17886]|nr:hypothetical protein MSPP1_000846 [Malassezia sp. CBS 17886]
MTAGVNESMNAQDIDVLVESDQNNAIFKYRRRPDGLGTELVHAYKNLGGLFLKACAENADSEYVVTERRAATYAAVLCQSTEIAHGLRRDLGLQNGDRVAIISRNTIEYAALFWGILLAGGVPAPVNGFQTGDVMAACMNLIGTRFVFADEDAWAVLRPHLHALFDATALPPDTDAQQPPVERVIVVAGRDARDPAPVAQRPWMSGSARDHRVDDFDALSEAWRKYGGMPPPDTGVTMDDMGLIMFTSGTTSLPKAVLSTQSQVVAGVVVMVWNGVRPAVEMLGGMPALSAIPKRRVLLLAPLFHAMGLLSGLIMCTLMGDAIIVMHKYTKSAGAAAVHTRKASHLLGVGFMVREVLRECREAEHLMGFASGGATPPEDLAGEMDRGTVPRGGGQGYGLTETNSGCLANGGSSYRAHPDSVGIPCPLVEILIQDPDTGRPVTNGATGELLVRSPCVAERYFNNKKATEKAFLPDGFFRTGDLARQNADGAVFILDRLKDMIIRGGENISCTAVEHALERDARIVEAAVLALPDNALGERVAAICVASSDAAARGSVPTAQELANMAATTLPKHAVPEYVWVRTDPLMRNATGKILKTELRAELRQRVDAERHAGRFALIQPRMHM